MTVPREYAPEEVVVGVEVDDDVDEEDALLEGEDSMTEPSRAVT